MPPETAVRHSQRGDTPPPPWSPAVSPRTGTATNWGRRDNSSANIVDDRPFERRLASSSGAVEAAYSPRRSYTSVALAEATTSPYSAGIAEFSGAPQSRQEGTTVAVPQAPASRRDSYGSATVTNSNNILNASDRHASRSPAALRSTSMETVITPRPSSWNHRHMLRSDAGETIESSRTPHGQLRTAGWRRIASGHKQEGGGSNTAGDATGKGGSEVWEWNGRRVVIQVSPPKHPPSATRSEGEAKTTGDREGGKWVSNLHWVRQLQVYNSF